MGYVQSVSETSGRQSTEYPEEGLPRLLAAIADSQHVLVERLGALMVQRQTLLTQLTDASAAWIRVLAGTANTAGASAQRREGLDTTGLTGLAVERAGALDALRAVGQEQARLLDDLAALMDQQASISARLTRRRSRPGTERAAARRACAARDGQA
jgi:hypothetical protein